MLCMSSGYMKNQIITCKLSILTNVCYKHKMQNSSLSLQDFQVLQQLGMGTFGKVQLVQRNYTNQIFAMKSVFMSKLSQKDKENALNEVRLLASINLPYVIGYKGAFYNANTQSLCVLMQYADGGDLERKIKDQLLGMQQTYVWKVVYQLLQALKALHKHKIAHRDIKSANVFFAKGIAKLGDLNVSKIIDKGWCETQTGTPYYTSPQIWKGQKYSQKCDIWSLGCVAYEMCMLSPPFRGKDFPTLYKKVTSGKYEQISSTYSIQLKQFIRLCLIVSQANRPSAQQLLQTSILKGMELSLQKFRDNSEAINIIDPIKCPRVLKFLNSKLPQINFGNNMLITKKSVGFVTKRTIEIPSKSKIGSLRRIKSQKIISSKSQIQKPIGSSKKIIKLPPLEKEKINVYLPTHQSKKQVKIIKSNKRISKFQGKQNIH